MTVESEKYNNCQILRLANGAVNALSVGNALDMMLMGKPVTAEQALAWGLIDDIAEGELIAGALALAEMPWLLPKPTGAFPRTRGGPMFQGDMIGASRLLGRLNIHAHGRNGWAWKPAPLIERLATDGDQFSMLND